MTSERLNEIKQEALKVAKGSPLFSEDSSLEAQEAFVKQIMKDLLEEEEQKEEVHNA